MNNLVQRSQIVKNKKGFTLIELIVVIVIIGILAAILIPRFTGFTDKARAAEALVWAKQVATAFDAYEAENGAYSAAAAVKTEVAALSGVAEADFTIEADGGVTATNASGDTAGRATADDPVEAM